MTAISTTASANPLMLLPPAWQPLLTSAISTRGKAYWSQGLVTAMGADAHGSHYIVSGTHDYEVQLQLQDPLRSQCNCPHAHSVPVCKHMVAAWLHAHAPAPAAKDDAASASVTPTATPPKKTRTTKAEQQRQDATANLDFLQTQSAAQLCTWIAAQCDRDAQLRQQLTLWRKQTLNTPHTPAQWRSFLVQAMPQRQHMYGRELQQWANHALKAVQPLAALATGQAHSIRSACTIALMRLFKVMETADDSYGQCHALYEWLKDLLLQSLQAEAPPASWLKDFLALVDADPWGYIQEATVLEHASEALRQSYMRHAVQAWQAWCQAHPPTPPKPPSPSQYASHWDADDSPWRDHGWEHDAQRRKLRERYLRARRQELDINGQIQLMQQTACDAQEWSDLVAFCEAHQRHREALACAQLGLQHYPKNTFLNQQLLHCYRRDGWDEEAMALAQQRLDADPHHLQHLEDALQCAIALGTPRAPALQAQIERYVARRATPAGKAPKAPAPLNVSAPMEWLMAEGQTTQALALLDRPHVTCLERTLYSLAQLLPAEHHLRAVALIRPMLEQAMPRATSPYQRELQLVQHILARLPTEERGPWLNTLRTQYKQKTNFIKGLAALNI